VYKYNLNKQQETKLKNDGFLKDFADFFQSADDYQVKSDKDGFMDQQIFESVFTTMNRFYAVRKFVAEFSKWNIFINPNHAYRDKRTNKRLQEQGFFASPTSQHLEGDAVDCSLSGFKPVTRDNILLIAEALWKNRKQFSILQIGMYWFKKTGTGFIHIGFESTIGKKINESIFKKGDWN